MAKNTDPNSQSYKASSSSSIAIYSFFFVILYIFMGFFVVL